MGRMEVMKRLLFEITSRDEVSWLATVKYEDLDPNLAPSSLCPAASARLETQSSANMMWGVGKVGKLEGYELELVCDAELISTFLSSDVEILRPKRLARRL